MTQRDERGYEVPFEGEGYVERRSRGSFADFSMTTTGLEVRIEEGSGFMQQACSTFIHTDILILLMERAGYVVELPSHQT